MIFIIALLLLFPQPYFTQDNIELPDIELTIKDQSVLNTISTENALLKDRNPKFQEVYLEELNNTKIQDASFLATYSQRNYFQYSSLKLLYGSYDSTYIDFLSQNLVNNLFYRIYYDGHYRDNAEYKSFTYPNTTQNSNTVAMNFAYTLSNVIFDFDFMYQQFKVNFDNISQNMHYIPIDFQAKYWLNEYSHITMGLDLGATILALKDIKSITIQDTFLLDSDFNFSYSVNPVAWNYINIEARYALNHYGQTSNVKQRTVNTGYFKFISDFYLGKGFIINAGGVLVTPSIDKIYGWPELRLAYNYLNIFMMDIKISGDFNVNNAKSVSKERQFYSVNPSPEAKWVYASSITIKPSPYIWFGSSIEYNQYRSKRIYEYNKKDNIYQFTSVAHVDILGIGAVLSLEYPKIFELTGHYTYQNIPQTWLLFTPHKFDITLGLGYKPVGFWFETEFIFYASRKLHIQEQAPLIALLNISITQKVHKIVSLSLEINNILDQNIQFLAGTYYGGVQAYGGVQLYF